MWNYDIKSLYNEDISILVRPDNHPWNYLCECGDASGLSVKEIQQIRAVFISHTHIDHFVNFDAVIRHQIGIQRRVVICGPAGIARQVQARILSYTWNLIQADAIIYEIREVRSLTEVDVYELIPPVWELIPVSTETGNVLFEDPGFKVTFTLLDHKIPTLAYLFTESDTVKIELEGSGLKGGKWVQELKAAFAAQLPEQLIEVNGATCRAGDLFHLVHLRKGDTLGVIMDHAAHPDNHALIKAHFSGCKTVLIESFYKDEDSEFATVNYHSYASMSGKIMRDSGVENAVPVHFSRKYTESDIQELVGQFEQAFRG